jgi:hypothetical protein
MKKALLALPLVVLAACQSEPTGRPPPPPPAPGVSGTLTVRDAGGTSGPFKLSELKHLAVEARYSAVEAGSHPARIDVFTPGGLLYTQYRATLEVAGAGEATLSRVLEVAGTPIEGFQQVGAWRFVLTVDEGAPLATAEVSLVE